MFHASTHSLGRRPVIRRMVGERANASRQLRNLSIESLEQRMLLAVSPGSIAPIWFENLVDDPADAGAAEIRLQTSVDDEIESQGEPVEVNPDRWIVQLKRESLVGIAGVSELAGLLDSTGPGFQVLRGLGAAGLVLIRTPAAAAGDVQAWLGDNQSVEYFEPNASFAVEQVPNDPGFVGMWGLHNTGQNGGVVDSDIDAPEAWDISNGSRGVTVAVIDSGVDYTHPDLSANIWTNPNEIPGNGLDDDGNGFVDDVHGYDFANNDNDPMDDHYHGTHVAGTIAAIGHNGIGVTGVNWIGSIMALKFIRKEGWGYTADAIRAVNYATMMRTRYGMNVRVTNNSWGGGDYSPALRDAIAASDNAGILFVSAAGNKSRDIDANPFYPASYDVSNVISVAATNRLEDIASFSNFGTRTVDLAAPGDLIVSTYPGNQYAWASGTSMAAPHVAGVAALAWSFKPNAPASTIRDAIFAGVELQSYLKYRVATGGRLNANNTLAILQPPPSSSPPDEGPVVRWTGNGGDFNWHNGSNWSTGRVPGPEKQVVIDIPGENTVSISVADAFVVSLDSEESVVISGGVAFSTSADSVFKRNLTISGAALTGSGNVTVYGSFNWNGQGGTLAGPGRIIARGGIEISGQGYRSLSRTIDNYGTAVWAESSTYVGMSNGARFNNLAGATFDARADMDWFHRDGELPVFHNEGVFLKSVGTGTASFDGIMFINKSSIVEVESGTLRLTHGQSTGTTKVNSGAVLNLAVGTYADGPGSQLTGAGTVLADREAIVVVSAIYDVGNTVVQGGAIRFNSNSRTGTLSIRGGAITGPGNLDVTGRFTWTDGGTLVGTGQIGARGGITIDGSGYKSLGRTIDNYGEATWSGDNYIGFSNGAVFNNFRGAVFWVQNDSEFFHREGAVPTFNNEGDFRKNSGNGVTRFDGVRFNNSGLVGMHTGSLLLNGGGISTGSYAMAAETVVNYGVHAGLAANDGIPDTLVVEQVGPDIVAYVNGQLWLRAPSAPIAMITVNGSNDDDTINLMGTSVLTTVRGNTGNDTIDIRGNTRGNLDGGDGNDLFHLHDTVILTGNIQGGVGLNGGYDTLSHADYKPQVRLVLSDPGETGYNGEAIDGPGESLTGIFGNIDMLRGSDTTSNDQLFGANELATWNLDETQTYIGDPRFAQSVDFCSFEVLRGGSQSDIFTISNDATAQIDGFGGDDQFHLIGFADLNGTIDGGDGTDELNYIAYDAPAWVNIPAGTAAGTDGIRNIENVIGASTIVTKLVARTTASSLDSAVELPPSTSQIEVETDFVVELWMQDAAQPVAGISGGQLDVRYTTDVLDATALNHGGAYSIFPGGSITDSNGLADDFGGATLQPALGATPNWARLGYATFTATSAGIASIQLQPGSLPIARFGVGNVPWDLVSLDRLILELVEPEVHVSLQSASDTGASDSDGITNDPAPKFHVTVNLPGMIEIDWNGDGVIDLQRLVTYEEPLVVAPLTPLSDGAYPVRVKLVTNSGSSFATDCPVIIDTSAPVVEDHSPYGTVSPPLSRIVFGWSEALWTATAGIEAIAKFVGPAGDLLGLVEHVTVNGQEINLEFQPQSPPGVYSIELGPEIRDVAGNRMAAPYHATVAIGQIQVDVVTVRTPSEIDRTNQLSRNLVAINEWEPFFAEVWLTNPFSADGVVAGFVDLHYDTARFTAREIHHGALFNQSPRGQLDDLTGVVSGLGGETTELASGVGEYVLLARVKFEPVGSDQSPVDEANLSWGPYSLGLEVASAESPFLLVGRVPIGMEAGPMPITQVESIRADVDDNNTVDFGDFSIFAAAFGRQVTSTQLPFTAWADFDNSGTVDFGDFSLFAPWFGKSRDKLAGESVGQASRIASHIQERREAADDVDVRLVSELHSSEVDHLKSLPDSLESIPVGESYVVTVWMRDLTGRGIAGGQLDLLAEPSAVQAIDVDHSALYNLLTSGALNSAGYVENLGGATLAGMSLSATEWVRLGQVRFRATAEGPVTIQVSPGELSFSLFGVGNVPWSSVIHNELKILHAPADEPPTLESTKLTATRFGITKIEIEASKPLNPATSADRTRYQLELAGRDSIFGTRDDQPVELRAATYEPSTRTISVFPAKPIPLNRLVRIKMNSTGLSSVSQNGLQHGTSDLVASNATIIVAAGTRITYMDVDFDLVTLSLSGGGMIHLTIGPNEAEPRVSVQGGASMRPILSGRVQSKSPNHAARTVIRDLILSSPSTTRCVFPADRFRVGPLARPRIDELLEISGGTLANVLYPV